MKVQERFLKYISFTTTSDENSQCCPSTKQQLELAKFLAEELEGIGMQIAVRVGKDAYLLHSFTGLRCFTTSKSVMPVATETLSERMVPTIGIVTVSLQCFR